MKILNRLPISDEPASICVGVQELLIKRFQIFVWVSIDASRPFPAILDTGHSHNSPGRLSHHTVRSSLRLDSANQRMLPRLTPPARPGG
jgi:hypothetical protein